MELQEAASRELSHRVEPTRARSLLATLPKLITSFITVEQEALFTCFPLLPLELRQSIWNWAYLLAGPQEIEVHAWESWRPVCGYNSHLINNSPPLLVVCPESRDVGLQRNFYTPIQETIFVPQTFASQYLGARQPFKRTIQRANLEEQGIERVALHCDNLEGRNFTETETRLTPGMETVFRRTLFVNFTKDWFILHSMKGSQPNINRTICRRIQRVKLLTQLTCCRNARNPWQVLFLTPFCGTLDVHALREMELFVDFGRDECQFGHGGSFKSFGVINWETMIASAAEENLGILGMSKVKKGTQITLRHPWDNVVVFARFRSRGPAE